MHMIKYISERDLYGRTVLRRSSDLIIPMYLEVRVLDQKKKKGRLLYLLPGSFLGILMSTFPDTRCPVIVAHSE